MVQRSLFGFDMGASGTGLLDSWTGGISPDGAASLSMKVHPPPGLVTEWGTGPIRWSGRVGRYASTLDAPLALWPECSIPVHPPDLHGEGPWSWAVVEVRFASHEIEVQADRPAPDGIILLRRVPFIPDSRITVVCRDGLREWRSIPRTVREAAEAGIREFAPPRDVGGAKGGHAFVIGSPQPFASQPPRRGEGTVSARILRRDGSLARRVSVEIVGVIRQDSAGGLKPGDMVWVESRESDAHGVIEVQALPTCELDIRIDEPGMHPSAKTVHVQSPGTTRTEVLEEAGRALGIRIVDRSGEAVRGARVTADQPGAEQVIPVSADGCQSLWGLSDAAGLCRMEPVPSEKLTVFASLAGLAGSARVPADAVEVTIVLSPEPTVGEWFR